MANLIGPATELLELASEVREPGSTMPEPASAPAEPASALPELDAVLHAKLRLAVVSLLATTEQAEFTWLRQKTGSTDGNLGAHLLKLEEAGYVGVEKRFVQRKPVTLYRITHQGRTALMRYVQALKALLGTAVDL